MEFYRILQDIMERKDLNIPKVARMSGLSDSTVRAIFVRKSKTVSLEVAFKLAAGLSVSLDNLYYGSPSSEESEHVPQERIENFKPTKQEIGSILKHLREANGYTQKEVAEHFGRKQQIVGHWETGYAQPDVGTLLELCNFYGADISKVFGLSRKSNKAQVRSPDNLDEQDVRIARAYHAAGLDDRAVVEAALRKYVIADDLGDGQKMA